MIVGAATSRPHSKVVYNLLIENNMEEQNNGKENRH